MVAAMEKRLSTRPYEGRLPSEGRAYLPWESVRGAANSDLPARFASLRVPDERGSADMDGLALLVAGDPAGSVRRLELIGASRPSDPDVLAALGIGYLGRAKVADDPRDLPRALDAIDRASRLAGLRGDLLFNRAVILGQMGASAAAIKAWDEYQVAPDASEWRAEADRRRADQVAALAAQRPIDLASAVQEKDPVEAAAIIDRYPEEARIFAEIEAPARWGAAVESLDHAAELRTHRLGSLVAKAMANSRTNTFSRDIWLAIDGAGVHQRMAIASGHVRLKRGLDLYDRDLRAEAYGQFETARDLLRSGNSPAWIWADLHIALMETQRRELISATSRLDAIGAWLRDRSYPSFLARQALLRGVIALNRSGVSDALAEYRVAIALYEQQHELADAAIVYNTAADALRIAGDQYGGWGFVVSAMSALNRIGSGFRRYQIFFNAATFSQREGLLEAALDFQNHALSEARDRGPSGTNFVVEALLRRSILYHKRNDIESEANDLDQVDRLLPSIGDERYRFYQATWLRARRGEALTAEAPALSWWLTSRALDGFRTIEPSEVPIVRLQQSRAALSMRETREAHQDLVEGIQEFERQRRALTDPSLRISYFDASWELYQELVSLKALTLNDWPAALILADDARARSLAEIRRVSGEMLSIRSIQASLGPSVAVLSYFVLPDQILWWLVTKDDVKWGTSGLSAADLKTIVADLYRALDNGNADRANDRLDVLHEALLTPIARMRLKTLVVVPDGPLHRVPFSALRDRASERYLIEDTVVVSAPSIRTALAASKRLSELEGHPSNVLAVGEMERDRSGSLPSLPEAAKEVHEVAAFYRDRIVLVGANATAERFTTESQQADVVHFAGHAVANEAYPSMSYLLLSPSRESPSGAIFAYQLFANTGLRARVFVLAACRTASGAAAQGEGPLSLAWPVLASGVPSVVASLWDLDDASARSLVRRLHQGIATGVPPATALREAQIEFLRTDRTVTKWAALVAIGGTALH